MASTLDRSRPMRRILLPDPSATPATPAAPRRSFFRRLVNESTLRGATINSGVSRPPPPARRGPHPFRTLMNPPETPVPSGPDLTAARGTLTKAELQGLNAARPTTLTGTVEGAPGAFRYAARPAFPEMTRPLPPPAPKPAATPPAAPAPGGGSKLRYVTGPKATPPASAAGTAAKAATAAETAGKVATAGETAAKAAAAAETAGKVATAGAAATKAPGFFRTLIGKAALPLFLADVGGRATRAFVDATNPTNQGGPAGMLPGETPEQYRKRAAHLLPGQAKNPQQTAGGFFRRAGSNLVGEGKRYVTEMRDLAVSAGTAIGEGLEKRTRPFSEDGTSPALSAEEMAKRAARQKAADEAAAAAAAPAPGTAAPAPAAPRAGRAGPAPAAPVPLFRRQADANADLHRRNMALRDETILTPGMTPTRSDKYQQALFRKTSALQAQESAAARDTALEQTRITAKGAVDAAAAGAAYTGAQFSKKVQDAHAAALAAAQGDVAKKKIESALEALNKTIERGVPDESNEGKNRDLTQDEMTAAYDQYLSAVGLDPAEHGMGPSKSARKPTREELLAERARRESIRTGAAGAAT